MDDLIAAVIVVVGIAFCIFLVNVDTSAQVIDPNRPPAISPVPGYDPVRAKIMALKVDRQGRVICSPRSRVIARRRVGW